MPKKTKPRYGWRDAAIYTPVYLSHDDFKNLADMLQIESLSDDIKVVIQDVVLEFCAEKQRHPSIPRQTEVKAALSELQSTTKKLLGSLEQIDTVTQNKLETASLPDNLDRLIALFNEVERKDSSIHFLLKVSQTALDDLPANQGGRPNTNLPLRSFVSSLVIIYEAVTGRKETIAWNEYHGYHYSEFLDFVSTLVKTVDPKEIFSDTAFAQLVKQALKSLRYTDESNILTLDALKRIPTTT